MRGDCEARTGAEMREDPEGRGGAVVSGHEEQPRRVRGERGSHEGGS